MKVIGIDYGEARIGIAASDDAGMLAHPVKTIKVGEEEDPAEAIPKVVAAVEKLGAEVVVVGIPFQMDGKKGEAAERVEAWVEQLTEALPEQDIQMMDERLTTVVAQSKLREAGKKTRKTRGIIDQVAAVEILQSYLEAQQQAALDDIGKGGGDPELAAFRIDEDDDEGLDDLGFGGSGSWDVDGEDDF